MDEKFPMSPFSGLEVVEEYFIENRHRLMEVAAFLDRLDRAGTGQAKQDFRMKAFHEAIQLLSSNEPGRVAQMQMIFSDPTTDPRPALDRKAAYGAFNPALLEGKS